MASVGRYQPIREIYKGYDVMVITALDGDVFVVSAVALKNGTQVFATEFSRFPDLDVAVADVKGQVQLWIDQQE